MNTEKSKLVNTWDGKEGFDFLGSSSKIPKQERGKKVHVMAHIRAESHEENERRIKDTQSQVTNCSTLEEMVKGLNRIHKG